MQKIKSDHDMGANIRKLRMNKKITQEQMAAKLQTFGIDISRSTYAKIESGIHHVMLSELRAIRIILNASWEDILGS